MVVANQIVTEPEISTEEQQYGSTPEDKLQKAIYILENEDPDYNLIADYFYRPGVGYCVQGLLLELSGAGHWESDDGFTIPRYSLADENYRNLGVFGFLANFYDLGDRQTDTNCKVTMLIDESKLPEDTRIYMHEIIASGKSLGWCILDGKCSLATINNAGIKTGHPKTRKVLADILRYNAFK